MNAPNSRVRAAASDSHRKHRAWWDSVCRIELGSKSLDVEEAAECQMRLKFAYQDFARMKWDKELLLSSQWIDQVTPEDFLDWCRWQTHLHAKWTHQVEDFASSEDFNRKVEETTIEKEQAAQAEFQWALDRK